ncbi:MAG: hypothetical protein ABSA59_22075, partial [Terriglobia bacterium]
LWGGSGGESPLTLWSSANPRLTIVAPEGDIAAERLELRLAERGVRDVSRKVRDDGAGNVIFVGTPQANPALRSFLKKTGKLALYQGLQDEEYRIWSRAEGPRMVVVAAGGGTAGSLYAVGDLVNYHLQFTADKAQLPASLDVHESPRMKIRYFWNWDSRTHWDLSSQRSYLQRGGSPRAPHSYPGAAESFRADLTPMIDFMSEHKINALVLFGFVRDEHGGVAASKELCEYAKRRGVKILPGVGVDQYGGFYYQGQNKFNIETWSAQHPELRAMDKAGHYLDHTLCMDKEANRRWFREGIRWLFQTFPIAGVNLEFGEFRVCYCPDSVKAREAVLPQEHANMLEVTRGLSKPSGDPRAPEFYIDLGRMVSWEAKEIHTFRPGALITYAAYTGFDESLQETPPYFLKTIPPYAIVQWTLTDMVNGNRWPDGLKSPAAQAIGYFHAGNVSARESNAILYPKLARVAAQAYASGLEGVGIYGEVSGARPITELNYLVFSEFTFNPGLTEEEFVKTRLAPYYGGEGPARQLLQIASLIGFKKDGQAPDNLDEALRLAGEARDATTGIARQRWEGWVTALQSMGKKQ